MDWLLTNELVAEARIFGVADLPFFFQPVELIDFVCDAKAKRATTAITRLLDLLRVALRDVSSL